ncbi:MAG: hypothetical protein UW22_C0014G0003 [Candidatus Gottesmanbacteria bacterium GW2011_GWB1_44_11c]|uniref:Uncharacterized protein n=1 Tax=Candidatus Gottesmanbacteria bacterium GW2011_GWB1_44_11c TaxID=1618447 RepID=A0A0G1JRG4_9BACT|nr:MAG: hypothetical protein UW22_C0014G0003 [Candidatus Gottesmanbacteria bacterium GW2011_GWB1_44_11c]HCM81870.1 hypothetical protein [Patescibacteria group bacterium]
MGKITAETKCGECFHCMTVGDINLNAPDRTGFMCVSEFGPNGAVDPALTPAENFRSDWQFTLAEKIENGEHSCGFRTPEEQQRWRSSGFKA